MKSYVAVAVSTKAGIMSPVQVLAPTSTTQLTTETTITTRKRFQWKPLKRILCGLTLLVVFAMTSMILFRFIKTEQCNDIIKWIQV